MNDNVNSPKHYKKGKYETIDVILDITQHYPPKQAYTAGNVIKYISRANDKGNKLEDLKKAEWYLKKTIELEKENG